MGEDHKPMSNNTTMVDQALLPRNMAPVPDNIAATLRVVQGPGSGETHRLLKSITGVGRDEQNDLVLDDTRVSNFHMALFHTAGEFRIRDLGSTNGTFLNGSTVTEYALRHGDWIQVGGCVLRFEMERAAAPTAPPG